MSNPAVKVDLDELERKARGALDTSSNMGGRIAEHVLSSTPQVTLALVARIRELEAILEEVLGDESSCGSVAHYLRDEVIAIVEKGAVLP